MFDVENTWIYGKNKQYISRLSQPSNNSIAVVSGITINNGVNYYTDDKLNSNEIFKDCLTISTRGEYSGSVFYHDEEFVLANNILTMPMPNFTKRIKLYIGSCIQKLGYGGYQNYPRKETLKNDILSLPTLSTGELAFDYMEAYIRELEEERVRELAAYLAASGLEDYHLTATEQNAIDLLRNGKVEMREFRIGELFEIHPTKSYGCTNAKLFATKGNTPVIVNSSMGNGIGGYVALEPTEKGNMITYSDTTTSDAIFYQPDDFIGYSHVQGLYPYKKDFWNESTLLYFLVTFKKSASGRFDYANKFNRAIAKEMFITLPVLPSGEIDYAFMQHYISAVQKIAIKNVVLWKDRQIAAAKGVVGA